MTSWTSLGEIGWLSPVLIHDLTLVVVAGLAEFAQEPLEPAALGEETGQDGENGVRAARVVAALVLSTED